MNKQRLSTILFNTLILVMSFISSAYANPTLVKDIAPTPFPLGSNPRDYVEVNGLTFFSADTPEHGTELYATDGTQAGTYLIKDIFPGSVGSRPTNLINVSGMLYFRANDGIIGEELWTSDGTAAGTVPIKDIHAGLSDSSLADLTNSNGKLFFRANDGVNGFELWTSDGTPGGTLLVKDINTGGDGSPAELTDVNGTLFFRANDGVNGRELWMSDGTPGGTMLVKDISTGGSHSTPLALTNVNGALFFRADDGATGFELWTSDGTPGGTMLVKDINTGGDGSPDELTDVNGTLFFSANDGTNSRELWTSDGTPGGTMLVKDINTGGHSSLDDLTDVNGTLFFTANDGIDGNELWKSDGTMVGTVLVEDINVGFSGSFPDQLTEFNGMLFFRATDNVNGFELWASDGMPGGTMLVKDINIGGHSSPSDLTDVNGTLFFSANDGVTGNEFWKSDGTMAGTEQVRNIATADVQSGRPRDLVTINGFTYFTASDDVSGTELWKSDGTMAGTALVKDIVAGASGSFTRELTNVNGVLFFTADDVTNGRELWTSDGTPGGTMLVKDIVVGNLDTNFDELTGVNGMLFFEADDGTNGRELWKSDGTPGGTMLVKDINTGGHSSPSGLTDVNGTLFFRASDGTNGSELWKSDGTSAGTVIVKDILTGFSGSFPVNLTDVDGTLFFNTGDGLDGELWTSDGTPTGTVMVKAVTIGPDTFFDEFTNVNGVLYFIVDDDVATAELWKSDGTLAGTGLVKGGFLSSSNFHGIESLTNVNGTLFFVADDVVNGEELWTSDGTLAGTMMVKDIRSGPGGSFPEALINLNGTLFFQATDDLGGDELWQSDGTTAGTQRVVDMVPGTGGSQISSIVALDNNLLFRANDGVLGDELWKYEVPVVTGTGQLGDFIWEDLNGNGLQDYNEPGLGNVLISLRSCTSPTIIATFTTDPSGMYLFDQLPAGDYQMEYILPSGYHFSPENAGHWSKDSNADVSSGLSPCLSVADNQQRLGIDVGGVPNSPPGTGVIGDFVWDDLNKNGIQDANESGLGGVLIELLDCNANDVVVATTSSNPDGSFAFNQVGVGSFKLQFYAPVGYEFSPTGQGYWANDSNAKADGQTNCLSMYAGQVRNGIDAGLCIDPNANVPDIHVIPASLDFGGVGISSSSTMNVTVVNMGSSDLILTSIGLGSGSSSAFMLSPASSPIPANGAIVIQVTYTPTLETTDTGSIVIGSNDPDEPTVTIALTGQGNALAPNIDVNPASLDFGTVDISNSSTLNFTIANTGSADLLVSGVIMNGSLAFNFGPPISAVLIPPNSSDMISVTYTPLAETTDTATIVITTNDPDEPTVTIPLIGQGNALAPEINLDPALLDFGSVQIGNSVTLTTQIQNLGETALTYADVGTCGTVSGDFLIPIASGSIPANSSAPFMVTYTPSDMGADTGCIRIASNDPDEPVVELNFTAVGVNTPAGTGVLGDYVWDDLNGNGKQDGNEPGLANVTIELLNCDGPDTLVTSTTSNSNGHFSFNQVGVGNFKLRFTPMSGYSYSPTGRGYWANDSNAGADGKSSCLSMSAGQTRNAIDGGYVPDNGGGGGGGTGQFGDYVWDDLNNNGIQNNHEPGLANVSVELWTCNGSNTMVDTAITDNSGHFLFTTLGVGNYRMKYLLPPNYHFANVGLGNNYQKDSNAKPSTGNTPCLYFNAGQIRKALDAGMHHN